jgi:hypothetical protein
VQSVHRGQSGIGAGLLEAGGEERKPDLEGKMTAKIIHYLLPLMILTAVAVVVGPFLIALGVIILAFNPRVDWPDYWAHLMADGTKAIWHRIFGAPKVQIGRKRPKRRW